MKLVIYTGLFLFIFGAAWVFYLDHQNKHFVENLPKLPASVPQSTDTVLPEEDPPVVIEQIGSQKPDTAETPEFLSSDPPDVHQHPHVHSHSSDTESTPLTILTPLADEKKSNEKIDEALRQAPLMEPREKIRQGLIQEFGDIPEVDIVMQYMPAVIEDGKVVRVQEVTQPASILEYHKAIATLWPTPENLRAVERTKELMEWRGGPFPSWVNPEHVTYTEQ